MYFCYYSYIFRKLCTFFGSIVYIDRWIYSVDRFSLSIYFLDRRWVTSVVFTINRSVFWIDGDFHRLPFAKDFLPGICSHVTITLRGDATVVRNGVRRRDRSGSTRFVAPPDAHSMRIGRASGRCVLECELNMSTLVLRRGMAQIPGSRWKSPSIKKRNDW